MMFNNIIIIFEFDNQNDRADDLRSSIQRLLFLAHFEGKLFFLNCVY